MACVECFEEHTSVRALATYADGALTSQSLFLILVIDIFQHPLPLNL